MGVGKILKGVKFRIRTRRTLRKEGRLPFDVENVALGISSPKISQYTANLYREVQLLEKALNGAKFTRSLEVGCGYGRVTPWIMRYSKEHYAVDPEPELLKLATKSYPTVKFLRTTAQNLPFPDDYFDLIAIFSVLHHIPPGEFQKAVEEIKRVATPNATIFLHERVRGRGGLKFRSWPRPIETYKRLFYPWKLTRSFDRKVTGVGMDKLKIMKVMLFQGVSGQQKIK